MTNPEDVRSLLDDRYIRGKTKEELVSGLLATAAPGSPVNEQQKMAILVCCVQDLEKQIGGLTKAINAANDGSGALSQRVYWLTVLITAGTVLGAVATWATVFK